MVVVRTKRRSGQTARPFMRAICGDLGKIVPALHAPTNLAVFTLFATLPLGLPPFSPNYPRRPRFVRNNNGSRPDETRMTSRKRRIILDSDEEEAVLRPSSAGKRHGQQLHIPNVGLRTLLLPWFDVVHDARSMPWRIRYDPALPAAQKAQHAYQVASSPFQRHLITFSRSGSPRLCSSRHASRP